MGGGDQHQLKPQARIKLGHICNPTAFLLLPHRGSVQARCPLKLSGNWEGVPSPSFVRAELHEKGRH